MENKSQQWYIDNNDFEGAKSRLETTSPRWKAKWFEVCKVIFDKCQAFAKKYVLDPIGKAIHRINSVIISTKRKTKFDDKILISEECSSLLDEAQQKCYLFEFLDENDNLLCSKVGTTVRKVTDRLKEELNSSTYKNMGAVKAIIRRIYDCGTTPAEGLESFFRANYIKRYPLSFKKNDRFINIKFDVNEADNIYNEYISQAV